MPIKSRWSLPIPDITLPTYLFTSPNAPLPNNPALIDPERPDTHFLTHSTFRLWSQRFAAGLRAAGLKDGDRVLLFSGNTLFFPVVVMGVIMAGGIFTGANPTYVARELAYQLSDCGAWFLLAAEGSLDTALEAAETAGVGKERVFVFDDGLATFEGRGKDMKGVRSWHRLIASEQEGKIFSWEDPRTKEYADRTITLNYSSGTTGVPKGVEITHKNYVANTMQTVHNSRLDPNWKRRDAGARWLCFLPMYHAMAQTIFCVTGPLRQIPVYVMPRFAFLKVLENVQKYRITDLILVPPVVVAFVKHPAIKKFDLSSVERALCGAAPLGREVSAEFEKLWPDGHVNIRQGWGMTEITCSATAWHPNDISNDNCVGEIGANTEVKLMDDEGITEIPRGERGEIWVRGPHVMKGYWRRSDATKDTKTPDGWLKTGDVGVITEKNKIYVVDRKKELIKVKGAQVAPAELEAILLDHPAVADAAVIGVIINEEEYPRAYVVLNRGKEATSEEIQTFMNTKVSKLKRLVGGVRFIDAIPKNPSGKILRKFLRDQVRAEVGDQDAIAAKL